MTVNFRRPLNSPRRGLRVAILPQGTRYVIGDKRYYCSVDLGDRIPLQGIQIDVIRAVGNVQIMLSTPGTPFEVEVVEGNPLFSHEVMIMLKRSKTNSSAVSAHRCPVKHF